MTVIALLSGLAGSVITIALEKLIDYYTLKQQNEHELKRAFYENKLRAAEAAVSHWSKVASAVGILASLYEKFASDDKANFELFLDLESSYSTLLKEANNSSNEFSSAILLYFDINEEEFWNSDSVKDLFEHLSAIQSIFIRAEELNLQRNRVTEPQVVHDIDATLNKLGQQAKEHIKKLSEVYSDAQKLTKGYLKMIRKEMKKYEYKS